MPPYILKLHCHVRHREGLCLPGVSEQRHKCLRVLQLLQRYLERTTGFSTRLSVSSVWNFHLRRCLLSRLPNIKVAQYGSTRFGVITSQQRNIAVLGERIIIISITPFIFYIIRQPTVCHSNVAHINSILQPPTPPHLHPQEVINVSRCNIITWPRFSSLSNLIHQSNRS